MRNFLTKTQQLHSCVIVAELVEPNLFVTNAVWFSWDYWGVVEIHGGAGKWRRSLLVDQIEKNGRFHQLSIQYKERQEMVFKR